MSSSMELSLLGALLDAERSRGLTAVQAVREACLLRFRPILMNTMAALLGAGPVADAFFVALRFPNLFRSLFAEGAFSAAFVPIFVGTLADNLRLPRPEASDAELVEALTAVDAADWARALPEGLATPVGSGGHPLTEAQGQQLALARLVLADPHTLVLDEATSSLDVETEREVQAAMEELMVGRTTIVIAHRLSTVRPAHRIHVMEAGQVIESGTHEELVELGGLYAALWRVQTGERS